MGRTVINETENKQTVILNDSPEGVEGGYFDQNMEWHEFGDGGNSLQPILHLTVKNSENSRNNYIFDFSNYVYDGHLHEDIQGDLAEGIAAGGSGTASTLLSIEDDVCSLDLTQERHTFGAISTENCTFNAEQGSYSITVTDPTKEASAELNVFIRGSN